MGLIHIEGDYYIRPDDYCYALVKRYISTNRKNGEQSEAFDALTYHDSIAECIKAYIRETLKSNIAESPNMELREALDMIRLVRGRTDSIIAEATRGL